MGKPSVLPDILLKIPPLPFQNLERVGGIEPPCSAWKADVLPLNYTRIDLPNQVSMPRQTPNYGTELWVRPQKSRGTKPRTIQKKHRTKNAPGIIHPTSGFAEWWRGKDSNLRRLSRQIYSLLPLTAREPLLKMNPEALTNSPPFVKNFHPSPLFFQFQSPQESSPTPGPACRTDSDKNASHCLENRPYPSSPSTTIPPLHPKP